MHFDICIGEDDGASSIAEFSETDEIFGERGHDVSFPLGIFGRLSEAVADD